LGFGFIQKTIRTVWRKRRIEKEKQEKKKVEKKGESIRFTPKLGVNDHLRMFTY
jgi:hypothetical protein